MKARIIEIEREEIIPGMFRRKMWSSIPVDRLTSQDTQEFFNRTDELWPEREVIPVLAMRRIQHDIKQRPHHFFESISFPPQKERIFSIDFSTN